MIEEIIGNAPASLSTPVFNLLSEQKEPFMKWLVYNAWHTQKQLAEDGKNETLRGILLHIRILMQIASKPSQQSLAKPVQEKKVNPFDGVSAFRRGKVTDVEVKK